MATESFKYGARMKLGAVLLNCTLKKSPAESNAQVLMDRVITILEQLDCECETVRAVLTAILTRYVIET